MKQLLLLSLLCAFYIQIIGQEGKLFALQYDNQFEGGQKGFSQFVVSNLSYPRKAYEAGRQGRVIIGFTLMPNNRIVSMIVKNSVGMGCDEEAIRLLKLAETKLKPISDSSMYYEFSVNFTLPLGDDIASQIEKAENLYSAEKYKKALPYLDEIVRRLPYNLDMILKRGIARSKSGNLSGACADWTRIKELKSNAANKYLIENCK